MTERATQWSVTINNPTASDDENINLARQKSGWHVYGQKEKGENGTEHYQLAVKTTQVRFTAMKKAFPRAHIEVCRDWNALMKYVVKTDTRVSGLVETDEKYPSITRMWDLLYDKLFYHKMLNVYPCAVQLNMDAIVRWAATLDPEEDKKQPALLVVFDSMMALLIEDGFHVEHFAVNPQVRSSWLKFAEPLMKRCFVNLTKTERQTDTVENNVAEEHNHAVSYEEEQEVHVPEAPSP